MYPKPQIKLKRNWIIITWCLSFLSVDCIWGDWKKGSCSKSCGGGTRTNERIKVVKEEHGGTCEGESTEVEDCNKDKCPRNVLVQFWNF